MKPGTRVRWRDHDPDDPEGTIREATAAELAYVATCASSYRAFMRHRVVVMWDGSDRDGVWVDPDELEAIT